MESSAVLYGFFGDVHGDVRALEKALQLLQAVDRRICLGDVAGGPNVAECCEILRTLSIPCVAGNHDVWEQRCDSDRTALRYLEALPRMLEIDDFLCVHSDFEGEEFLCIHSEGDAVRAFRHFPQRLVFFGHTHLAQLHERAADGTIRFHKAFPGAEFRLRADARYLINVPDAREGVVVYAPRAQRVAFRSAATGSVFPTSG